MNAEFLKRANPLNVSEENSWRGTGTAYWVGSYQVLRSSVLVRTSAGGATKRESPFLETPKLNGRRPTRIYYYRELRKLRDPPTFNKLLSQRGRSNLGNRN